MNTKRSLILLGVLLFLGFSCTQEDANPIKEEQGARFEEHTLNSVPGLADFLGPYVNANYDLSNKPSNAPSNQQESFFSQSIDYDYVLARYNEEGFANFSMKVEDYDGNPFTFTNLIIPRSTEGEFIKPYLLKYEMSDEFIQEYLMHYDISQFQGKITQFTLGMMQSNSSPNRAPTDPDNAGDGPSDGSTDPTNDANIECEIIGYTGSGQPAPGDGGRFEEQCMHYQVTVKAGGEYWYSYIEIDYSDCILVWVNEQSASGSINCPETVADGEIPMIPSDQEEKPCEKDPLNNMEISNYNSGRSANRFGCVRVGNPTCADSSRMHKGIDLLAEIGTDVYSMYGGTLINAATQVDKSTGEPTGWGNWMIMKSTIMGEEYFILYAHLQEVPQFKSNSISKGQKLAISGESATEGEPHLHLEFRKLDNSSSSFNSSLPVNPENFFSTTFDANGNTNTNSNCN